MYRLELKLDKELGDDAGTAKASSNLGVLCRYRGDLKCAKEMAGAALKLDTTLGRKHDLADDYRNLGVADKDLGNLKDARAEYKTAVRLYEETNDQNSAQTGEVALAVLDKSAR